MAVEPKCAVMFVASLPSNTTGENIDEPGKKNQHQEIIAKSSSNTTEKNIEDPENSFKFAHFLYLRNIFICEEICKGKSKESPDTWASYEL